MSGLKIAFQVGESLTEKQWSTVELVNEAVSRGHLVFLYSVESLCLDNSGVYAYGAWIEVPLGRISADQLSCKVNLDDFDAIFVRQNPPVEVRYINSLHLLNYLNKPVILNSTDSLMKFSEKLSIFHFPDFILPTIVTENYSAALSFFEQYKDVMIKLTNDYSGRYILRAADKMMFASSFHIMKKLSNSQVVVQKCCAVMDDKRVLFINGKPWCPVSRTDSSSGVGPRLTVEYVRDTSFEACALTKYEEDLCKSVGAKLLEVGVFVAVADIIGGQYLLEINVTSPDCVSSFAKYHKDILLAKVFVDEVEKMIWNR